MVFGGAVCANNDMSRFATATNQRTRPGRTTGASFCCSVEVVARPSISMRPTVGLLCRTRTRLLLHQFEDTLSKESRLRNNLEQVCVDTVFGSRGVQLLNERGLAVMKETGVPVVPAHALVEGQQWATPVSMRRLSL